MTSNPRRFTSADEISMREIPEQIPLSPSTSPDRRHGLTKRQEQNRAAQRAFRERRAQTLKEMEIRLSNLEKSFFEVNKSISSISTITEELNKLKNVTANLYSSVEALSVPSWTVPNSEEVDASVDESSREAILGALRPSSTDPTLTSEN